jgi:hypothetical protein
MSNAMPNIIDAQRFVQDWIMASADIIDQKKISMRIAVPTYGIVMSKSTAEIETSSALATFTLWGNGQYQIIFVDSKNMVESFCEDGVCSEQSQLLAIFDRHFNVLKA